MIRILSTCETAKGGIATYLRLFEHFPAETISHSIVAPRHHIEELPQASTLLPFAGERRGFLRLVSLFRATVKAIEQTKPDIVFFHSSFTLPMMSLLRLIKPGMKFIYCPHGWAYFVYSDRQILRKLVAIVEGFLAGFSDVVVNISSFELRHAVKSGYRGVHVLIENAVEECQYWKYDQGPGLCQNTGRINLLFVGRLDKQKGFDVLKQAYEKASQQRSDLLLHVVGEGVLSSRDRQVRSEANVCAYGWLSPAELETVFASCDIVIVPSRWEGFGLVAAEALRAGRPILVSDRGALPEIVTEGQTGFVVPLTATDMANALMRLRKQSLVQMRDKCREEFLGRFHSDRFVREFTSLFETLSPGSSQEKNAA
jgi:glycosyltransferase involved in cell wall biosynthesis